MISLLTRKCEYCGKEFSRSVWRMKTQRFCSRDCFSKYETTKKKNKSKVKFKCENCSKILELPAWEARTRRFCSIECTNKYFKLHPEERNYSASKGKNNPLYKEKQYKHNGIWIRNDENELELEHRYLIEKEIGRKLKKSEIIHHIDGKKYNNSSDNLYLFTSKREHSLSHANLVNLLSDLLSREVIYFDKEMGRYKINDK